ncbi:MAG: hypothetical protein M9905_04225 [Rhizobiaceae bacterium]|nr:hypothetical protein [Rhizobiaceae bacterium]
MAALVDDLRLRRLAIGAMSADDPIAVMRPLSTATPPSAMIGNRRYWR